MKMIHTSNLEDPELPHINKRSGGIYQHHTSSIKYPPTIIKIKTNYTEIYIS